MSRTLYVITGGAGFIGSHLCEAIVANDTDSEILAIDNLRSGNLQNLKNSESSERVHVSKIDLVTDEINEKIGDAEFVYHLAANPEVRIGKTDTEVDFDNNILATRNILEVLRKSEFHGTFLFASTSTVYGEAWVMPTPETYGPLLPVSMYGASKLACESLISGYASLFDFRAKIVRFANVVGGRSNHGVISDFVKKLKTDSKQLEVLGDGSQSKSYIYFSDCIAGLIACTKLGRDIDVFNLGSDDTINVLDIARIVIEEMNIRGTNIRTGFGDGVRGGGWPGDVKNMLLDCAKLKQLGWRSTHSSTDAIRLATKDALKLQNERRS